MISTALVLAVMASPALADRAHHLKPSAPVSLALTPTVTADGKRVVVLDAVVTRDAREVVLRVGTTTARFGATRAGQHRRLEAQIAVPADGVDVIGSARITAGASVRSRTVLTRLGPAAATKPAPVVLRTVAGRSVAEVRE